jgi:ABC-type lipoprotein release transport system permease subunit
MEVVGVVAEVKQALASESAAEMYVPYRQADQVLPVGAMSIVMRTTGDPLAQANSLRAVAQRIDPNQPITGIRTMEENVAQSISEPRFRTTLLAAFAGVALVLAAIGIFGVMAYSVTQRTREMGVRMALGASRGGVLRLVLAHGVRLTLLGVGIGVTASFLVTRYVSGMLFNVHPYDPMTLIEVAAGLVVVSLCACYIPAMRATRVSPSAALREE